MPEIAERVLTLRHLKIHLSRANPRFGPAISPRPSAPVRAIVAAERRLGIRLPPGFRAFLGLHDGWPFFFQGAPIFGTDQLAHESYAELARAALAPFSRRPSTPVGLEIPLVSAPRPLITFGLDDGASTIFAFNPAIVEPSGEMQIVLVSNGIAEQFTTFGHFLDAVGEMMESELVDRRKLA